MRETELWAAQDGGPPAGLDRERLFAMTEHAVAPAVGPAAAQDPTALLLLATEPKDGLCGVVLVPDPMSGHARLNGVRLGGGLHLARHGDRVDLGRRSAWFAVAAVPDRVTYDPELHGEAVFCLRTKARLKPGDDMVECCGKPERPCGMRFKAEAWVDTLPCPDCGASPGQEPWRPPPSPRESSLQRLLLLARGDEGEEAVRGVDT